MLLHRYNTGVENYINCLLMEFDKECFSKSDNFSVFLTKEITSQLDYQWQNLKKIPIYGIKKCRSTRILWEHSYLPSLLKKENVDVLHAPGYIVPI